MPAREVSAADGAHEPRTVRKVSWGGSARSWMPRPTADEPPTGAEPPMVSRRAVSHSHSPRSPFVAAGEGAAPPLLPPSRSKTGGAA